MKFYNEVIRKQKDPESRRETIKHYHLAKYPKDTEVFIMPIVKKPMVGHLLRSGFKICSSCGYLIDTREYHCALCGKKFRVRIMHSNSKKKWDGTTKHSSAFLSKIAVFKLTTGTRLTLNMYREQGLHERQ